MTSSIDKTYRYINLEENNNNYINSDNIIINDTN